MPSRRLAAIVFTDIVGYTELMQQSEAKALAVLQHYKSTLETEVVLNQGSLIQYLGDGALLTFESASRAVRFSRDIQIAFRVTSDIPVRVGVHIGEIMESEGNIFGDAVNLASRIESVCLPGSVLVSSSVAQSLKGQEEFILRSMGSFFFKNISDPQEVLALSHPDLVMPDLRKMSGKGVPISIENSPEPSAQSASIKILIVEDDMIVAAHISLLLSEAGYQTVGMIPSGEAALEHLRQSQPDMILMDVNLKGEMDGVDTAEKIYQEFGIPVIFLTANSDQATFSRAKKTFPYAFISKPFKPAELIRAIELVTLRLSGVEEESVPAPRLRQTNPLPSLGDRIFVRDKKRMVRVSLTDIHFAEAERNYCRIHLGDQQYILSVPLKSLEEKLPENQFIRVHRSYLINLNQVDSLDEHFVFCRGKAIPVSKTHKEKLMQRLNVL